MNDELRHEEMLLQRALDHALTRAQECDQKLLAPRFGWTRDPPPTSGIVETNGFSVSTPDGFSGWMRMQHMPGLVDAAVYVIPVGTLWRWPAAKIESLQTVPPVK